MKIVADRAIPFLKGVLEPFADVAYLPGSEISPADVADADALIIRTRTRCGEKLLSGSKVRFIATATIGMDHIDAAACARMGIRFLNAPGCNAPSVAQYIASVLVSDARDSRLTLAGKTIGIVGAGHVGTCVEATASALGMRVLRNDPPRERREGPASFVSLDTLLRESDYVTLHTPLTLEPPDRTYHLADETFFRKMAKKPFFINASRGETVDPDALKSAVITGRVRGVALDVWPDEPDIGEELLGMVRYATPHIAGYSADGKAAGTAMSVRALAAFFGFLPLLDFYPESVPLPEHTVLTLPPDDRAVQSAVLASYDVMRDDSALRADPAAFESLRAAYPLRREFPVFRIANARDLPEPQVRILRRLGFQL